MRCRALASIAFAIAIAAITWCVRLLGKLQLGDWFVLHESRGFEIPVAYATLQTSTSIHVKPPNTADQPPAVGQTSHLPQATTAIKSEMTSTASTSSSTPLVLTTSLPPTRRQVEPWHSATDCIGADHLVAFEPVLSDADANRVFLKLLFAGDLTEVLIFNRYKSLGHIPVPRAIRMFDWYHVFQPGFSGNLSHPSPATIFCSAGELAQCWEAVRHLPRLKDAEKRVLAIGNKDTRLSENKKWVTQLLGSHLFSNIFYEAKDIPMQGVSVLPLGLSTLYLQHFKPAWIFEAIAQSNFKDKDKAVLACWGSRWKGLDKMIKSRRQALRFVDSNCIGKRRTIEAEAYWRELSRYRFLLTPEGHGVQMPKVAEALLVLTIPIVQRNPAFEDLEQRFAWPLAMVDQWEEITPGRLQAWHVQLAPKLEPFRKHLMPSQWFADILNA